MTVEDITYDLRVGQTKFYEWMAKGWMPQPWIKEGGVARWRTSDILDAIENFPNRAELAAAMKPQSVKTVRTAKPHNPWADQAAA
jgi:predicted DNA-binding transcriptional regulator AlpA